jgi:hypothetical protein
VEAESRGVHLEAEAGTGAVGCAPCASGWWCEGCLDGGLCEDVRERHVREVTSAGGRGARPEEMGMERCGGFRNGRALDVVGGT